MSHTGVLLINVGTPESSKPRDVFRYLNEFLTDGRVIDLPWITRQLLVRGLIVPFRYRTSAKAYKQIFKEGNSPLLLHGKELEEALQKKLGVHYCVELAMRYQTPSIEAALDRFHKKGIEHLVIIPLFPQYASATVGTAHQKVMKLISQWEVIPSLSFVRPYPTQPLMIQSFAEKIQEHQLEQYDHLLMSFHGLPKRHITKADQSDCCLKSGCCDSLTKQNGFCYSAQCYATAREISKKLSLSPDRYSISFQSRLGKDPWLTPYTSNILETLLSQGKKRILVACPSFVCDCLETLYEIGIEYKEEFLKKGGEKLDLVKSVNNDPLWVEALHKIVIEHTPSFAAL